MNGAGRVVVPIIIDEQDAQKLKLSVNTIALLHRELQALVDNAQANMEHQDGQDQDQQRMQLASAHMLWLGSILMRGVLCSASARVAVGLEGGEDLL